MPLLTDPAAVRVILETDSPWSVYALGDLAPQRWPHCTWLRAPGDEPALVLLYREFGTPVLFTFGPPHAVHAALAEAPAELRMLLHVRPEILTLLRPRYRIEQEHTMWRMLLDPAHFAPPSAEGVVRLGPGDLPALQCLYADGEPAGEMPDFFFPAMVEEGVFFGIWEEGQLIAVAGTHLVVPAEGVAAVGNIYTRRDQRGRGLAGRVTGAVTRALLRLGLRTVALNVNQQNAAAIRVYERLGYRRYCPFKEGEAVLGGS